MTPERWRLIEALYHSALAREEGERAAFLAEACASDTGLRRELELLLAQAASAEGTLDHSAPAVAARMASHPAVPPVIGERLGPYQILSPLGAGGMGEVYRARDTVLGREVAIKILPPAFMDDPERLARFEREARVLASLNHPNIATIHGIERGQPQARSGRAAIRALVMELVEGDTLAERIRPCRTSAAPGPDRPDRHQESAANLPIGEVLAIIRQIACALEAAHEKGIVHRDLKPANIKIRPDGTVKVLDFGLAKAMTGDAPGADATAASTMTVDGTRQGLILGTPAYMSPEQARGQPVDRRTDVWAFGCTLFEMLAGRSPFRGATVNDTFAAILERDPDWAALPAETPSTLCHLLHRCLEKGPQQRLRDIGEARIQIDQLVAAPAARHAAARERGAAAGARARSGRVSRIWAARRPVLAVASIVIILGALALAWASPGRWPWAAATAQPMTVAVLPFQNASSDPEHAYLAEGLADALIADLVSVPGVRVVSRMSMMRYAAGMGGEGMASGSSMASAAIGAMPMAGGMAYMSDDTPSNTGGISGTGTGMSPRKPLGEIARELGANLLLHGSVAREGDTVRVTASLLDSDPLRSIWERSYSRHVRELFGLQRDLAGAVTAAVTGRASRASDDETARQYNPAAHDAYLKGSYYQAHWRLAQAVESFERAVQLDPAHAPAQAGLARAYYFLGFFADIPPSVALAGMRRAATAALERDPLMAEAHAQLALVKMLQDWDWEGAEAHFRRALEISPGHAQIRHDYAHFLLGQGRQLESMEQTREAVALDPVNPMLISCLGWHSLFDARFEESIRLASEAITMMPDHWAQVVLGWALLGQGRTEPALAAFREAVRLKEGAFTVASLGHALGVTGRHAEARRTLDVLLARMEKEYVSPYDLATVYAGLGDADGTFRWLRRAADERSLFIVHVGWDSRFDRVRGDARLADLTAREMRLPAPQFAGLTALDRRQLGAP